VPLAGRDEAPGCLHRVVNAPRTCRRAALEKVSGIAPQLIATNEASGARLGVHRAGDESLPTSALPGDQTLLGVGRQHDLLAQRAIASLSPTSECPPCAVERALDEPVLPEASPDTGAALDALFEEIDGERLLEIVAGAPSERGDGGFECRVRGHDDHRGARVEHARSLEHLEAVESRHDDVGDDDVRVLLDAVQRSRAPRGYPVALSVTDIVMPGLDGLEVLERSRVLNPRAAVIVMTAYAALETAIAALRRGASDYLEKPFSVDLLKERVQRLLQYRETLWKDRLVQRALQPRMAGHSLVARATRSARCASRSCWPPGRRATS